MTTSLSSSLTGLTLLSGVNSFSSYSYGVNTDSVAVRLAKAAFTLPETTPPWKLPTTSSTTDSAQLSAIKQMKTLIDTAVTGTEALPNDVQTSFTTFKALDRLRILAEAAAKATTGSPERAKLDTQFAKGMSDLQSYLSTAPNDKLDIAFGSPTRRAESVGITPLNASDVMGQGIVASRSTALPGLTGSEQFQITLKQYSSIDQVNVDLSQGAQPPTLDSVAAQINAAIASVPLRNPDGSLATDANGQTQPRWLVHFVPDNSTGKWGFSIKNPNLADVSIDQVGAPDALVIATGQTPLDAPPSVKLMRLNDPAGAASQVNMGNIAAYDRLGTERAVLAAKESKAKVPAGVTLSTPHVDATTTASAIVTASDGSSYMVGTAAGELDANRPAGNQDLFLTKMDSEGRVQWQRMLGASQSASGAAISIAANGDVLVAGTVTGSFDTQNSDGDMVVARFDTSGEEKYATLIRSVGADTATAITSGADGNIYVAGKSANGSGDAIISRLDSSGRVTQTRTINSGGSDSVTALAMASDGSLLALSQENGSAILRRIDATTLSNDLGSYTLGSANARAMAVGADGSIAIGGATSSALNGSQAGSLSGGQDGFVAHIDAALSSATISYIGSAASDEVDSVAFMNGRIYAGGRTSGTIGAAKRGSTDGFVVSLHETSGAQLSATQFGQSLQRTEPVRIAAEPI